jgi:hypothetical protein
MEIQVGMLDSLPEGSVEVEIMAIHLVPRVKE